MTRKGLGFLPSPPDPRDEAFCVSRTVRGEAPTPERTDLVQHVVEVLDQGQLGSCVANAIAQGIRMLDRARYARVGQTTIPPLVSRLFVYWHARNQTGDADRDSGTFVRSAVKVLNKLGRCPESSWPYVVSNYNSKNANWRQKPPLATLMDAHDKRAVVYSALDATGNSLVCQIKKCIARERPVVFGTDISESFMDLAGDRARLPIDVPLANDPIVGGHCMLIVGYDQNGPLVLNSWGCDKGDKGYYRFTWEYMKWSRTREFWALG